MCRGCSHCPFNPAAQMVTFAQASADQIPLVCQGVSTSRGETEGGQSPSLVSPQYLFCLEAEPPQKSPTGLTIQNSASPLARLLSIYAQTPHLLGCPHPGIGGASINIQTFVSSPPPTKFCNIPEAFRNQGSCQRLAVKLCMTQINTG